MVEKWCSESQRNHPRMATKWGHLHSIKSTSICATDSLEQLEDISSYKMKTVHV